MTKFSDLNLHPKVLKAIDDAGYETPTPIQAEAIPPALEGRDVLGIAQTGTGKTASFTLPMITLLARGRARARMPRSLVLCPTRELAAQVAENFETYAKYVKLTKALLIGGVSFREQDAAIDRGVDVLIATPGRLLDHFERGKLILSDVKVMVVDEADRMLDMGFIPDIERIFGMTNPLTRQTLFFSATMAPEIERITNTFLSAPARIEVARQATTSETITQGVVMFKASRRDREASEKRKLLRTIIDNEGEKCTNAIIFCNRKMDVDTVSKSLKKYGYDASPIHGDLEQSHRTKTLDAFRDGSLRFLVASDVAARGLDVPNVSHVFNFDVPSHAEDYVHRIGRTGRAGRAGTAMMICVPKDEKNLADIERLVQNEIPRLENPLKSAKSEEAPKSAKSEETKDSGGEKKYTGRSRRSSKSDEPQSKPIETVVAAPTPPADTQADTQAVTQADRPQSKNDRQASSDDHQASSNDRQASSNDRQASTSDRRSNSASSDNRGKSGDNRSSSRSSNRSRGGRDNGKTVIGLGDHLPSFIALSFEQRRAG
ncbi:MAG: DEAD/DEAH box helicase [Rhodobacteraceae bacterium]|nr:DEAD/DEAH box helicase [Paracoccaceae bacterium]